MRRTLSVALAALTIVSSSVVAIGDAEAGRRGGGGHVMRGGGWHGGPGWRHGGWHHAGWRHGWRHRHGHGGWGWGPWFGAGVATGLLFGAAPYYWGPSHYYYPGYTYARCKQVWRHHGVRYVRWVPCRAW